MQNLRVFFHSYVMWHWLFHDFSLRSILKSANSRIIYPKSKAFPCYSHFNTLKSICQQKLSKLLALTEKKLSKFFIQSKIYSTTLCLLLSWRTFRKDFNVFNTIYRDKRLKFFVCTLLLNNTLTKKKV